MSSKPGKEIGAGLSAANLRFLAICFKHMKNTPEIDFEGVALDNPFKSASVARTRFGQVRRLIREVLKDGDHAVQDKGTPEKRKGDSQDGTGTPLKRTKKNVKLETEVDADDEIHDDEELTNCNAGVIKKEQDSDGDDGDVGGKGIKVEI